MNQEILAVAGEREMTAISHEEMRAQPFFERPDTQADGRLRAMKLPCRRGKTPAFSHYYKRTHEFRIE